MTWLLALIVLLWPTSAEAHTLGVSRGDYVVSGDEVVVTLLFRTDELHESPEEVATDLLINADSSRCARTKVASSFDPPDGTRIVARYTCPAVPRHLHVHAGFLERLPSGHAHLATLVDPSGARSDYLTVLAQPDVDVDLTAPPSPGLLGFVRAGVEHILTGADHLLFLLGLVLLPRGDEKRKQVRGVIFVLTAFTLGHSLSLAIATLGGLAPPSRVVEPLVALSVAYVGAENLISRTNPLGRRWLITFPFGLVHGFAFASGLLIVRLPRSELPLALLGFNLGVELGQLGVMALVVPLLFALARKPRVYDTMRAVLSVLVCVCGLGWFIQRVFG